MELQRLYSLTRKAVDEFGLIDEGDRIAVGISGGKDSLTLLYALAGLRRFYPKHFEIEAITVGLGIDGMDFSMVESLCDKLEVNYHYVKTDIYEIVFDIRKETNPCALCAKMRKGAFNKKAIMLGCNKVAYAHHKDDLIETLLLSLMYEGRIHTFAPKTYWDKTGLTLIRPLLYVNEAEIVGFKNKYDLPVVRNLCPADKETKREDMKRLIANLRKDNPDIKEALFGAVIRDVFPKSASKDNNTGT